VLIAMYHKFITHRIKQQSSTDRLTIQEGKYIHIIVYSGSERSELTVDNIAGISIAPLRLFVLFSSLFAEEKIQKTLNSLNCSQISPFIMYSTFMSIFSYLKKIVMSKSLFLIRLNWWTKNLKSVRLLLIETQLDWSYQSIDDNVLHAKLRLLFALYRQKRRSLSVF
jgi:hypothetical protein